MILWGGNPKLTFEISCDDEYVKMEKQDPCTHYVMMGIYKFVACNDMNDTCVGLRIWQIKSELVP